MNYVKDQYLSGEISYYVHTGDIVDDNPSYGDAAVKEWENATDAFEILDAANVQYGVNAGNHDVGSVISSINYDYYKSYFGNKRFANMDCYGGNLNDNEAHYDLITIGGIDFIFMYIGFGIEPRLETINYVKKILSMYKHRNAIICTHAYLSSDGTLDTDASGQILYDNYVVPNENVKMVFCGHTDGNVVNKKPVSEGRYVYEILNCYQFVQTNQYSVSHKISGLDCNGEGFLRDMVFDGNHVSWTTYSPVIGTTNPLGANDSRSIDVDFIREKRILETLNVSACQISGNSLFSYSSNDIKDINLSNDKNYLAIASASHDAYGFERL